MQCIEPELEKDRDREPGKPRRGLFRRRTCPGQANGSLGKPPRTATCPGP